RRGSPPGGRRPGTEGRVSRGALRHGAEQVPPVARHVEEHGDAPVRLVARLGGELDPGRRHALVRGAEVVHPQEEPDPPGDLVADGRGLARPVRLSQEHAGQRAGRADDHPPLRAPAFGGQGRGVLDELEAERAGEELDGPVVVIDDDREVLKPHAQQRTAAGRHYPRRISRWPRRKRSPSQGPRDMRPTSAKPASAASAASSPSGQRYAGVTLCSKAVTGSSAASKNAASTYPPGRSTRRNSAK